MPAPDATERPAVDPQPHSHEQRMALAHEIAERLTEVHADALKAVGIYGSTARGTDRPYSDLEMWCVLRTAGEEYAHEWTTGPWKAEVDVYSADVLLAEASKVEGRWPLTHGGFQEVLPLRDPDDFFAELRRAATAQPAARFAAALREVVVGELYEEVAKARNALDSGHAGALPQVAVEIATYGACAIGLANRRCISSATRKFEEARAMPDRPSGYEALAGLVIAGTLSDGARVAEAIERFWRDLVPWVEAHGITIAESERIPF